jgi:hypothetical protein
MVLENVRSEKDLRLWLANWQLKPSTFVKFIFDFHLTGGVGCPQVHSTVYIPWRRAGPLVWERSSFENSQLATKVLDLRQNYLCDFHLRGGIGLPAGTEYIPWRRAGPLVWERSSFVNSQLTTEVLDLRQNYLCDFHLRGGIGLPAGTVYVPWSYSLPWPPDKTVSWEPLPAQGYYR